MSHLPPPSPAGGSGGPPPATPPPPPPGLTARAGYVGSAAAPIKSVGLYRIGGLTIAAIALACASAVVALASIVALAAARDDAQLLLDNSIDVQEFVQRALPYLLMSVIQGVATIATAIVTIIWMYRIAKNHRTLHRGGTWSPGWAIGGWFLPPLLYVIPFLVFRELWKASDPTTPIGGEWRSNRISPLVPIWFVLYSIVPLVLLVDQSTGGFSAFGASERDLAQQIVDGRSAAIVSAVVAVGGAAAFAMLARKLDQRHRRLTGESTVPVARV